MRDSGGWAFLLLVAVAAVYIAWLADAAWLARFRYARSYPAHLVTVANRPHDCDFWGSPVGVKDCHYQPVVTPSHSSESPGAPVVRVDIDWEKVKD